jgi:ABC-type Zn2+ transport system substrate-binding protein/surface adhesin
MFLFLCVNVTISHDTHSFFKVAQDLGALFGTQSTDSHNHTHKSDHDHEHSKQEPDKNHEHKHELNQNRDYEHEHGRANESKSEAPPKVTPSPKGQKENVTKTDASSKFVHVRKKSVDWSQYFGIDRRKKKATFTAGQGTQNQDDEWMLQRYYEVHRNY